MIPLLEDPEANTETDEFYKGIEQDMDNIYLAYSSKSVGIEEFKKLRIHIDNKMSKKDKLNKGKYILWKYFADHLDNLVLSKENIDDLVNQTKLDRIQVRDFFKNQRSRCIKPIIEQMQKDIVQLTEEISSSDESIEGYLQKLSSRTTTENNIAIDIE